MTAVLNISTQNFGNSEKLPMFVLANVANTATTKIYNRFNKAEFPRQLYVSSVAAFAKTSKELRSFVIYILLNFYLKMANAEKVSKATNIVSKSATCSSTKTSKANHYQIRMELTVTHLESTGRTRYCGVIHTDIYQAANEHEALGVALMHVRSKYGAYHDIDLKSIKREQIYNIMPL